MKMTKMSALAAVSAAALLASLAPAALAQGDNAPKAISPEIVALMATQDKLHKIANNIQGKGFSGFYVDAGSKTLNVYWKGAVPAKVRTEAIAAKAHGLTVKIHPARYSEAELKAEAARIAKTPGVTSVAAKYDGSGIKVKQSAGISARSAVQSAIPLDAETDQVELAASRLNDTSPYKGGAYIENVDVNTGAGGSCSSGFGVQDSQGRDKLLTAAHCGNPSTSYFMTENNQMVGWVEKQSVASDSELIAVTLPAATSPGVWIGDSIAAEQNQFTLDVIGAGRTIAGDFLCDSGAYSGTICEIRAVQTGISINFPDFGTVNNLVEAVHTGGYSAGGNGDSGGPVFSVTQPGDRLVARGTLTAISIHPDDIRQCSGVPADPRPGGRKCSQRIIFPDITAQLADLDVTIKTVS